MSAKPACPQIHYEPYDLVYALDNAAEFLEMEEWPDPATKAAQEAANKAAAARIRAMSERYAIKHIRNQVSSSTKNNP